MLTQAHARKIVQKIRAEIRKGRRHDLAIFRHEGKYIAQFGISRSSKSQSHDYIAKQLFITSRQCRDLRDCPLTHEDYITILKRKGLLGAGKLKRP